MCSSQRMCFKHSSVFLSDEQSMDGDYVGQLHCHWLGGLSIGTA